MARPYPQELRDRVLAACDRGMKTRQVARTFSVSASWVRRIKQRRRQHGQTTPRPMGGATVIKIDLVRLHELVSEQPDATLQELRQRLGVACHPWSIGLALRRLGWSFKKKTLHAAEQDRPDVAAARTQWRQAQPQHDARRLIFVDETWAKTNMTRLRGRAPVGQRLVAKVPHGHWKTTTLLAALGIEGMRCSMVVDGAVDGDVFTAFVQQVLAPSLTAGDVVMVDNLSSHKSVTVRTLIEARGATLLYLPAYSPDLNPIEMIFAKIKQLLRSLACRTRDALWSTMQSVLDQVTAADAQHCFTHCGYTLHLE